MTTRHCEHVKTNGHFCGSPAMRGRNYCFYHLNLAGHRLRLERYAAHGLRRPAIELPPLEDAAAIQLALMRVTEALLDGSLDHRTAGLVLYSLQTASCNLRTMQNEAEADANANSAICNRYDSFEQDYELGDEAPATLRIDDPEEEEDSAGGVSSAAVRLTAVGSEDQPADAAPLSEEGSNEPATTPRRLRPIKLRDEDFDIPIMLTEEQYRHAQVAIFQYRMDHNIDANDRAAKVVPQRAAISQKIALHQRKPMASVTIEEGWKQLAAGK